MSTRSRNRDYDPATAIRRWWWLVLAATVVGALLLGGAALARPTTFTSEGVVLWRADGGQALPGAQGMSAPEAERALATQADVVLGDAVMTAAASAVDEEVEDLRELTDVELRDGANVLVIAVSGPSAPAARDGAAAVVDSYVTWSREQGLAALTAQADSLQTPIDGLIGSIAQLTAADPETEDPAVEARRVVLVGQLAELIRQQDELRAAAAVYAGQARVLGAAELPDSPSSLTVPVGLALGAGLGLLAGILVVVLITLRRNAAVPAG